MTASRSKVDDKRLCFNCNSEITYIDKNNRKHWYSYDRKWYCEKCNNKLFKNPKWHPINNPRRINPKGNGQITLKENPRKGVCSWCHKKIGDHYIDRFGNVSIIKQTQMHHTEYHNDPLKDTIELCASCHGRESNKRKNY